MFIKQKSRVLFFVENGWFTFVNTFFCTSPSNPVNFRWIWSVHFCLLYHPGSPCINDFFFLSKCTVAKSHIWMVLLKLKTFPFPFQILKCDLCAHQGYPETPFELLRIRPKSENPLGTLKIGLVTKSTESWHGRDQKVQHELINGLRFYPTLQKP